MEYSDADVDAYIEEYVLSDEFLNSPSFIRTMAGGKMSFSPYWKGYDAYWEGEFYNPYNHGSASFHAYNQGWLDANQKASDSRSLGVRV